jgi:hypothetical protein
MHPGAQLVLNHSEVSMSFPALSMDSGCCVGRPTFQMTRSPPRPPVGRSSRTKRPSGRRPRVIAGPSRPGFARGSAALRSRRRRTLHRRQPRRSGASPERNRSPRVRDRRLAPAPAGDLADARSGSRGHHGAQSGPNSSTPRQTARAVATARAQGWPISMGSRSPGARAGPSLTWPSTRPLGAW